MASGYNPRLQRFILKRLVKGEVWRGCSPLSMLSWIAGEKFSQVSGIAGPLSQIDKNLKTGLIITVNTKGGKDG